MESENRYSVLVIHTKLTNDVILNFRINIRPDRKSEKDKSNSIFAGEMRSVEDIL